MKIYLKKKNNLKKSIFFKQKIKYKIIRFYRIKYNFFACLLSVLDLLKKKDIFDLWQNIQIWCIPVKIDLVKWYKFLINSLVFNGILKFLMKTFFSFFKQISLLYHYFFIIMEKNIMKIWWKIKTSVPIPLKTKTKRDLERLYQKS